MIEGDHPMTKIENIKKIIKAITRDPKCLIRLIDDESFYRDYILEKYGYDNGLPTIDFLELFPHFNETVEPYSFLEGTSYPLDLALLKALAKSYDNCRYLEIGTWRGESVANVAKVAKECVTIDLPEETIRDQVKSESVISNMRFFSRNLVNVKHISHDSRKLDTSKLGKFDLIFVDGDHSYENVEIDTRNVFNLLRNNRSTIVWHDYGFTPEKVRYSVLAGILDGCSSKFHPNIYHVSNTLCAIYTTGSYRTTFPIFPQLPNKYFSIQISGNK